MAVFPLELSTVNLSTDAPSLILKYSVAGVEDPTNVTLLENVAESVTPRVPTTVVLPDVALTVNFDVPTLTLPVTARSPLSVVAPVTVKAFLTVVVPVVAPMFTVVPTPAKFTVVAVALTRLKVVAVGKMSPVTVILPLDVNEVNPPAPAVSAARVVEPLTLRVPATIVFPLALSTVNLSTDAPLLILKDLVAAVEDPCNVTLLENVDDPVTDRLPKVARLVTPNELRVDAPSTPRVPLEDREVNTPAPAFSPARVVAPLTLRVPATIVFPLALSTVNFDAPTLTLPVIAKLALRIVVVPVVAPIVTVDPTPAKFTAVAVVLAILHVVDVVSKLRPIVRSLVACNVENLPVEAVVNPIVVLFIEPRAQLICAILVVPVKRELLLFALVNTSASILKKLLSNSSFVKGDPLNAVVAFVLGVELLR